VSSSGPDYKPVVEFTAADGRVVRFRSRLQMNAGAMAVFGRRYQAGRQVPVRYRPQEPQQALLDTALASWAIGALVLAATFTTMIVRRRAAAMGGNRPDRPDRLANRAASGV